MSDENTPAPLPPFEAGHPHAVREALEAARHAIARLQNLYVTDKPHAYEDAMRDGEDANGARDEQREASWFIDEAPVLATIDAALLALDGRDAGRDADALSYGMSLLAELSRLAYLPETRGNSISTHWNETDAERAAAASSAIRAVLSAARAASAGGAEGAK